MGWTSLGRYINRNSASEVRNAVLSEITSSNMQLITSVLHTKFNYQQDELYLAVENTKENYIFGVVVLLNWEVNNKKDNLCIKVMDEGQGPCYYEAGRKLIDQLTPLKDMPYANRYAWEWRKACYEKAGCIYTEPMPEK